MKPRLVRLLGAAVLFAAQLVWGGVAGSAQAASVAVPLDSLQSTIAATHLPEPLVRTAPTVPAEDLALQGALNGFERRAQSSDVSSLTGFLTRYPRSGWAPAVQTNLGLLYLHDGYLSRALDAWQSAWALGRTATERHAKEVVDRAVGELVRLYASMGQFDRVSALFDEIGTRPIAGSATEAVQVAREELTLATKDPRHLFNCGPVALRRLILVLDPKDKKGAFLQFYRASSKGTNLEELATLAQKANFSYRLVRRQPGQSVPIPSLVHWKVGHFSAIVGEANGRYHVEDPVFPGSGLWVTREALDAEASGYFLVPAKAPTNTGWRQVAAAEASRIWGKGPSNGVQPGDAGDRIAQWLRSFCPMCAYGIKEATVGVTLTDTPVGYAPPIGPSTALQITYNQREDSQPANFGFFNVSPKWTLNWLTYVTDDPTNPGANVSRYLPGGGAYYYSGYVGGTGQFAAQNTDGAILVLASQSPVSYRLQMADGSVEVFARSDGSTAYPRNVFLSQVIDPQGNTLTLTYDSLMRLTALTDATGRQTTFTYGVTGLPLLVTQVTDPFGRAATLTYDASGRLASITDILGLTSSFAYDANSLVDQLTTPYGVTTFAYGPPGATGLPRFVQVTDPLGYNEREEWLEPAPVPCCDPPSTVPQGMPVPPTNALQYYRGSFYWDKDAYVSAGCTPTGGCDYTKARYTRFAHVPNTGIKSTTVENIKYPLENRIWYDYPEQTYSFYAGTYMQPIATARVLDDGTTQLSQATYDTTGYYKPTQSIDAVGRVTSFSYANQIDLATVSQTTAGGVQTTVAQYTYNTQHRPLTATDAAGQTTNMAYNAAGQVTSVTNPLSQTTTYHYDASANLTSITNANSVTGASYTYDGFDRVATATDSEGWTVSYSYDAADRITKVAYPDGTSQNYAYNKLDLASFQDRLGRKWAYSHDANRRLTAITDPAGKQTLFAYNGVDEITSRKDPNGNVTQWAYDLEGRPTTKTYADSSTATSTYETTTSRLKSTTDALGQTNQLSYARDNLPAGVTHLGAVNPTPNVSFAYDPYFARITSMTDGSGTTQYAYVAVGTLGALKVQQTTTPLTTIAYAYDGLGRMSSRTVGGSGAETFQYDAVGRLTNHGDDLGAFTLAYLGQTGLVTSRQMAGSTLATSWGYLANTADRRLASVGTVGLSAGNTSSFQYATNSGGFTTGVTQSSDAAIAYPPAAFTQSASYNTLNQLTNLSGQALTWDADGNLLADGARTYSWDAENRLVSIGYPGQPGKATAFAYDGLGRRISISSTPAGGGAAVATSYVWCGERLCQARGSGGSVSRAYYAEGEYVPGASPQAYYYGPDRIGSVRRVFTSGSAPAYDYDPYGAALQATAPVTDFNYAGTFYNADSGLYLTRHRVYDPVSGRFVSRDPAGETGDPAGNLYAYAGGNPVSLTDPQGLFCWPAALGAFAAGAFTIAVLADPLDDVVALLGLLAADDGGAIGLGGVAGATESGATLAAAGDVGAAVATGAGATAAAIGLGEEAVAGATAEGALAGAVEGEGAAAGASDLGASAAVAADAAGAETAGGAFSGIGSTGQIGEAALQELGGESQVYFNSNLGGRYVDQLVSGWANEAKVGYQSLTSGNQLQIMKDVDLISSGQINGSTWHFFTSPVTGLGGPSGPLGSFLEQYGIGVVVH